MNDTKRQIIGFFLLATLFLLFITYNAPAKEEKKTKEKEEKTSTFAKGIEEKICFPSYKDCTTAHLENSRVRYTFYSKGAHYKAEMQQYKKTNKPKERVVLNEPGSGMTYWELTNGDKTYTTYDLDFEIKPKSNGVITLVYHEGKADAITITYTLKEDCLLEQKIRLGQGWDKQGKAKLVCYQLPANQEKGKDVGESKTYISYGSKYNYTVETKAKKAEKGECLSSTDWVSFHIPYFVHTVFFPRSVKPTVAVEKLEKEERQKKDAVKRMVLTVGVEASALQKEGGYVLSFYMGANTYKDIQQVAKHYSGASYERVYYFGWRIFGSMNKYVITPCFNLLNGWIGHPILALFLLLLLLSLLSFVLVYKQHVQQIKMKVVKPYLAAAKEKQGENGKFAESAFYRKVGINPLVMFFAVFKQIVVFVAMFSFVLYNGAFRQRRFLWMTDVTHYDNFIRLPVEVPIVGGHLSIIGLLLIVIPIVTRYFNKNEEVVATTNKDQAKMMKRFGYVMPFIFFGVINKRPAIVGIARLLTMLLERIEKWVCGRLVDEKAVTAEVVRRATLEDEVSATKSRAMSRWEKRRSKKRK